MMMQIKAKLPETKEEVDMFFAALEEGLRQAMPQEEDEERPDCDGECLDCENPCCDDEDDDEEYEEYDEDTLMIPTPRQVLFNDPYTTIVWADGSHTVVKCAEDTEFSKYNGFTAAIAKKLFGSSSMVKNMMEELDTEAMKARKEEEKRARKIEHEKKITEDMVCKGTKKLRDLDRLTELRYRDLIAEERARTWFEKRFGRKPEQ